MPEELLKPFKAQYKATSKTARHIGIALALVIKCSCYFLR